MENWKLEGPVSIYSQNVWMLLRYLTPDNRGRFKKLLEFVRDTDYDVYCFQELWPQGLVSELRMQLAPEGYNVISQKGKILNPSGLVMITKFNPSPRSETIYFRRTLAHFGAELLSNKGLQYVPLDDLGITVVNTHVIQNSSTWRTRLAIQQAKTVCEYFNRDARTILAADMNLSPTNLALAGLEVPDLDVYRHGTVNTEGGIQHKGINAFIKSQTEYPIDYLLVSKDLEIIYVGLARDDAVESDHRGLEMQAMPVETKIRIAHEAAVEVSAVEA